MCKVEGFTYAPSNDLFWMHGNSTETDYIYVTTQMLGRQQLQFISEQVGTERTLLICCSAYKTNGEDWTNLTLKKIPQAVLHRCEWNIEMSGNSYEWAYSTRPVTSANTLARTNSSCSRYPFKSLLGISIFISLSSLSSSWCRRETDAPNNGHSKRKVASKIELN